MKQTIVYIISRIHDSQGFVDLFCKLQSDNRIHFQIILINPEPSKLHQDLAAHNIEVSEYLYPGKRDIIKLTYRLFLKLRNIQPHIVHTHLLDAGLIGGLSAWLARVPFRIYTRHHGDMHFFAHKKGKLYDKIIHSFYHKIVGLSAGHIEFLKQYEHIGRKLVHIPNFYDPAYFNVSPERVERVKQKYKFSEEDINIGVNARWTDWKGVQYTIMAVASLLGEYKNLKLYLFNAKGDYTNQIHELLRQLPHDRYHAISFEGDIMAVYKHFDIFVHVPVRIAAESFGLVYIEAMGSGVPCVFTLSGIACDVAQDGKNALVVPFMQSDAIAQALVKLIENEDLRKKIVSGSAEIAGKFTLQSHINKLYHLYNVS